MDPLSIAASCAGLATACLQISGFLYTFVDDSKNVDTIISGFCEEIVALSRILDSISKSLKENRLIAAAQTDPNGELWSSLKTTFDDCQATLDDLDKTLKEVNRPAIFGISILRRPTKQVMLNLKMKDIGLFRQRIQYYNGAMQLPLQMINLCVSLPCGQWSHLLIR
jgi:hypothetical protein